jgi:hypothetical protein
LRLKISEPAFDDGAGHVRLVASGAQYDFSVIRRNEKGCGPGHRGGLGASIGSGATGAASNCFAADLTPNYLMRVTQTIRRLLPGFLLCVPVNNTVAVLSDAQKIE